MPDRIGLRNNYKFLVSWRDDDKKTLIKYKLVTNSLGFRDFQNTSVKKVSSSKKRLILIGDSFTEGVGLEYKDSLLPILENDIEFKKIYNQVWRTYECR